MLGLGMLVRLGLGVSDGIGVAAEISALGNRVPIAGWELGVTSVVGSASTTGVVQPINTASNASMPTVYRHFGTLIRKR